MIYTRLLEKLTLAYGVSGDEEEIRSLITELCQRYADEISTDAMGNLIVHRVGTGAKVMLAAHMDSVGVMVTHIEENGFLRFVQVGGLEAADLCSTPVRLKNGCAGLIALNEDKLGKEFKKEDLFLDIGAKDAEEAKTLVQPGDTAAFAAPYCTVGNRVIGPYLDNRTGCAALIAVLKSLKESKNDLYFVFTVQEEVGTRGAKPAAWGIAPDYALVVDVTCPDDVPEAVHDGTTAVGKGAAIKVMDHSVICSPAMVECLEKLAKEQDIPAQRDVLRCGGTDGGPMHLTRAGVCTGGVSIPCRYTHTPTELVDLGDLDACVRLITAFCESEL